MDDGTINLNTSLIIGGNPPARVISELCHALAQNGLIILDESVRIILKAIRDGRPANLQFKFDRKADIRERMLRRNHIEYQIEHSIQNYHGSLTKVVPGNRNLRDCIESGSWAPNPIQKIEPLYVNSSSRERLAFIAELERRAPTRSYNEHGGETHDGLL